MLNKQLREKQERMKKLKKEEQDAIKLIVANNGAIEDLEEERIRLTKLEKELIHQDAELKKLEQQLDVKQRSLKIKKEAQDSQWK